MPTLSQELMERLTCHGLSQSRAIGIAPSQAPMKEPTAG